MNGSDAQPIETLKLSDRDKARLVQAVDAGALQQAEQVELERRNLRVSYIGHNVLVTMHNLGASVSYSVVPRNISRGGFAFVHGRFVYPGTKCVICLLLRGGNRFQVEAEVVRCRHISGIVHEVCLRFAQPIDLEQFVTLTPDQTDRHSLERAQSDMGAANQRAWDTLRGAVLLVDNFPADQKLIALHLRKQRLRVDSVATRGEAEDAIEADATYDLVLVDLDLGRKNGTDLIQGLRAAGYTGPLIAMSAEDSDRMQARATNAGANAFLNKPLDPVRLVEATLQIMALEITGGDDTVDGGRPIMSTLSGDHEMRPLLRDFVSDLANSIAKLSIAEVQGDLDMVRDVCYQLKGAGTSYGFEVITDSAGVVIQTLEADTRHLGDIRATIDDLLKLLRRVQFV